jgi:hypothetical protein
MPGVPRSRRECAIPVTSPIVLSGYRLQRFGVRGALGYRLDLRHLKAFRLSEFASAVVI